MTVEFWIILAGFMVLALMAGVWLGCMWRDAEWTRLADKDKSIFVEGRHFFVSSDGVHIRRNNAAALWKEHQQRAS